MKRLQASLALPRGRAKRRHYDQAFKRHLVELTLVPGASVARAGSSPQCEHPVQMAPALPARA